MSDYSHTESTFRRNDKNEEDQFMCVVRQTIGYNIDKSELIRALNYDRDQYERGYHDGESAGYQQAERKKEKDIGLISTHYLVVVQSAELKITEKVIIAPTVEQK